MRSPTFYTTVINVFISILLSANIASTSINEDESRIYSEGIWPAHSTPERTIISSGNGNSRFDVGGILTGVGLKQGASIMGLVVFPILFPVVALLSIALFIISVFGTGTAATVTGRQFSSNGNSISLPLSLDKYFTDISNFTTTGVAKSPQCMERICCEITARGSKITSGSKIKRLMKTIRMKPTILNSVNTALSAGHDCPVFNCTLQEFFKEIMNDYAEFNYSNSVAKVSSLVSQIFS